MQEDTRVINVNSGIFIFIFILMVVGGVIYYAATTKNQTPSASSSPEGELQLETQNLNAGNMAGKEVTGENMNETAELKIEDLIVGQGEEATTGTKVTVNYLGTLTNGQKFDSSYDRDEPFSFNLGAGEVIAGWDQGVAGMKVGGKRKLIIPSSLAYGDRGVPGSIPGRATLIFEVELLGVE